VKRVLSIILQLSILYFFNIVSIFPQGVRFNDQVYDGSVVKGQFLSGDNIQLLSSSSIKKYCPKPGNQINYSSSVAWAIAWGARTIMYAQQNSITDIETISSHLYSPAYIYQKAKDINDQYCSEGITMEAGLKVLKEDGVPLLRDFLYFCGGVSTTKIDSLAKENQVSGYAKLFERSDSFKKKLAVLKKSIMEEIPVVVGMNSPPSFRRAKEFWHPTEDPNTKYQGQALCVVGYDDNKYGGAFEVMNSWGKYWGNNGFIWIRYDDFFEYTKYAYEVFLITNEEEETFNGSLEFRTDQGVEMSVKLLNPGYYKMKETYRSGMNFRINVFTGSPAFVYTFGFDFTNSGFQLFPSSNNVSAALSYKTNKISIPDENSYVQFDDNVGTDFLFVLFSKVELDIESIMYQMANSPGSHYERVKKVILGGEAYDPLDHWYTDRVSLDTKFKNARVKPIMIEISHN